ncbi:MAG: sigma-70 family RNA polymerase sigma factor [Chitinophagales bacterium]|nr:sigma-70 family RNA polymerase sigma factor [Chitinophagaceae bacterium]MCB9063995.1 sigma-70 family RNA polymerase sigma factor [Chitinophagales bacterium]
MELTATYYQLPNIFIEDLTATKTHISDEQVLVNECINGDRIAQRSLYDSYVDYMTIVCLRYLPNSEDAQEAMMDGFCNVFKNLARFEYRGVGSLKAWMKKIMVNQCLMFLRKRKELVLQEEEIIASDPVMDTDAISRLGIKELMQIIHELPDGYRMVFNLYTFEGMTHNEIGTLLGISPNTSKSQLHKAKTMLQKRISGMNQ